jgi:lysozyme family protein
MSTKKTPPKLADVSFEYWKLFLECRIRPEKLAEVKQLVTQIVSNRHRYERAAGTLGTMPWWFVALIHALEANLNFSKHLHNGDPLTARTTHVPAGRPAANPQANPKQGPSATNPYTWEESAQDALRMRNLDKWSDWSIRASLYQLEAYNGWGYRLYHPDVLSPYLWSYTNQYTKGKYAADGKWDANLVSKQPGAAALLRLMVDTGVVFPIDYVGDWPLPDSGTAYA